jgi:hypothetical protein
MIPIRIIVAGGRDFSDRVQLYGELSSLMALWDPETISRVEIVSGGAQGADTLGAHYAFDMNIPIKQFFPDWDKHGKPAGHIRNKEMADYASGGHGILVAFWDGKSKGTKNMITTALHGDLEIHAYRYTK